MSDKAQSAAKSTKDAVGHSCTSTKEASCTQSAGHTVHDKVFGSEADHAKASVENAASNVKESVTKK